MQRTRFTVLLATAAVMAVAGTSSAATIETVTGLDGDPWAPGEWATDDIADGTPVIAGDHGAPDGFGSEAVVTRTPASGDRARALLTLADPVDADMVGAIGYNVWRDGDSTAADHLTPSLQMVVDFNGLPLDDGGFATLVFEPVYNGYPVVSPVPSDQWLAFDAFDQGNAVWWSTRDVGPISSFSYVSLQSYLDANPDMEVLRIGIGQGSGNAGLIAAVDGLTFGDTTFDFETVELTADDCKHGGWSTNWAVGTWANQGQCVASFKSNMP